MLFVWIKLFIFSCVCFRSAMVSGQKQKIYVYFQLFNRQIEKYSLVQPEVGDSCAIQQQLDHKMFFFCPTDENCYGKTYLKGHPVFNTPLYEADVTSACETTHGAPLPVEKTKLVNAVHRVLRLVNDTVCDFSAIETLDVQNNGLVNMRQLGRANCEDDVGECPYKIKFLDLSFNRIEVLLNNSFCQFRQLEHLGLGNCRLSSVEEYAFVDLINLKEINLGFNNLSYLPIDLFSANEKLQSVSLRNNKLQRNDLKAIAPINSLQYLFLQNNRINNDDGPLIFPPNLKWLLISINNVQNIELNLNNLNDLTDLVMDNNNVRNIDANAFQSMPEVKLINLNKNQLEQLDLLTFAGNLKLEILFLSGNQLMELPAIGHLSMLRELYVSGNNISHLNSTELIHCTRLNYIDLSRNRLSYIDKDAFSNIRQLQTLNLANNRLSELTADFSTSIISQLFLSFNNFTKFTFKIFSPNLTNLLISFNQIRTIDLFDFSNGIDWNLTSLDLSFNRIDSIDCLKLPASIMNINLNNNSIRHLNRFQAINPRSINLRSINLQNNSISLLCRYYNRYYWPIFSIRLSIAGNPLLCSCENLWMKNPRTFTSVFIADLDIVKCKQLFAVNDTRNYRLKALDDRMFLCESTHQDPNRCKCPSTNSIKCTLPCPTNCTCHSDLSVTFVHFICINKGLRRVPTDLNYASAFGSYNVSTFSMVLDRNTIDRVEIIDFGDYSNSKFNSMRMRNVSAVAIDDHAFDLLTNLLSLDLSLNRLEALPDKIFDKLSRLKMLGLSNNRLKSITEGTFGSLSRLNSLFLDNNLFSQLPFQEIARLNELNNVTLNNNPWSCACAVMGPFRELLLKPETPVKNRSELKCFETEVVTKNVLNFNMDSCASGLSFTWVLSLTFALIVVVMVAGAAFRWRHKLRMLTYSRYGVRLFR